MKKILPLAIALAIAGIGVTHAQETPMTNQDTPVTNPTENQVQVIAQDQSFAMPDTDVEVTSSMPPTLDYGPHPVFKDLDTNGDGVITPEEATAYPPLANDFLYASHGGRVLTRPTYERWASRP